MLSPMPGRIVKLLAGADKSVKAGSTLIVLEAMKMEHIVTAPSDGLVVCDQAINHCYSLFDLLIVIKILFLQDRDFFLCRRVNC